MNYRLDFTKRLSITVEAENEDQAIEKAIRELNRPISIDIDEDDIVNIEPIYKGEKNDYPTTQPTGTHRQGNRLL